MSPWPDLMQLPWVFSCGIELKSGHKAVGYTHDIDAIIVLMDLSCQATCYCGLQGFELYFRFPTRIPQSVVWFATDVENKSLPWGKDCIDISLHLCQNGYHAYNYVCGVITINTVKLIGNISLTEHGYQDFLVS